LLVMPKIHTSRHSSPQSNCLFSRIATTRFETLTSHRSAPPSETSIICQSLRNFVLSLLHQEPHNKVSKSFLQGRPTMKSFESAGKVSKFRRVLEFLRRCVNGNVSKSLVTSRSFRPYLVSAIPSSGAVCSSSLALPCEGKCRFKCNGVTFGDLP